MNDLPLPSTITVINNKLLSNKSRVRKNKTTSDTINQLKLTDLNVLQNMTNQQPIDTIVSVPKQNRYVHIYDKNDAKNDLVQQDLQQPIQLGTLDALNTHGVPQPCTDSDIINLHNKYRIDNTTAHNKHNRHVFMNENGSSMLSSHYSRSQNHMNNDDGGDDELNQFIRPSFGENNNSSNDTTNDKSFVNTTHKTIDHTLYDINSGSKQVEPTQSTMDASTDEFDVDIAFNDLAETLTLPSPNVLNNTTTLTSSRKGHNRQLTPAITDILTVDTPKQLQSLPVLNESESNDSSTIHSQQSTIDDVVGCNECAV